MSIIASFGHSPDMISACPCVNLSTIPRKQKIAQSMKKKGPTRTDMLKRKVKEVNAKKRSNTIAKMSVEGRGL